MRRPSFAIALGIALLAACGSRANMGTPPSTANDAGGDDATDATDAGDAASDAGRADSGVNLIVEPDRGMTPIYDFVGTATKTIDMTMYSLDDDTFTALLTKAAKNGVAVRVILDQNLEMSDNAAAYAALAAGGVQVHWANPTYAATHQKTITVDGDVSAIMSLNLSAEDYETSRDFAVVTSHAHDVTAIEQVFEADFGDGGITPPLGDDLVWSPTNAGLAIVTVIDQATTSLVVENEEMSEKTVISSLAGAASRGVDVRVVMEASSSWAAAFATLEAAGVKVVTYRHAPIYIHAKVVLADYGAPHAKAFIGSENFSLASLTENRELGLITSDPAILDPLNATLTSDYDGGTPYAVPDAGAATPGDAGSADAGDATADADDGDDAGDAGSD